MEILNQVTLKREGNDCLITDYINLTKMDHCLFVVNIIEAVSGSWTGDIKTFRTEIFTDYETALNYFKKQVKARS